MTPFPPMDDEEAMPGKPPMQPGGGAPPMPMAGAGGPPKPPMPPQGGPQMGAPMPGGAPPQPGGQPGGNAPPTDDAVAAKLWERANQLSPQDIQALGRVMNREAGLIMLKLVPELSAIILEMGQMQGPEMQEIRGQFSHDDTMQQIRSKPAGGPPSPSTAPPGSKPPLDRSATGLRSI